MLWPPYGSFALYDGCMWYIDCHCSIYDIYGDWEVSDLIFPTAYFSVCVDVYPKSCWSILVSSDTFISRQWKDALLLSTVFRKEQSVT